MADPDRAAVAPVDLAGIRVAFGGNVVLDGVDLAVGRGFTGLIGPNGAGKTTCLNVISGYLRPDGGTVRVTGEEVTGRPPHRIAALGVSRTFQSPRLVPNLSALSNVMVGAHRHFRHGHLAELFGLPSARREERRQEERARELLTTFGLGDVVERDAGSFPIGTQKIIEVARALLNDPAVALLDEPAAGLGAEDVERLVAGLTAWVTASDSAVLIIEHDLGLISRLCPQVAVLHFGRIIQFGRPDDVLHDPVVVEAYLGADFAVDG
ncbi:ABC transporter ATP-binding protein [Geodermatophilus sp. CPCC 206100]|uniref:ABC transporter ATP-binding protein n=1 Tax=Geodermatophilus sp. CPCC 206100 TaxID=3020054 RepID=UPI003AFFE439